MKKTKRQKEIEKKVNQEKIYPLDEAINLLKELSSKNFDEGIEIHLRTGIDPKKGDQQIRNTVILPHGNGKISKIIVFAPEAKKQEILDAGADAFGDADTIKKIKQTGNCDFDVIVATPPMMKELAMVAKILGPRGLMPSPKNETVTNNITKTLDELKKGKIVFKNDDTANLHVLIGKASFETDKIIENITAFMDVLKKSKPPTAKGQFIKNISLSSSMGPGLKIQL